MPKNTGLILKSYLAHATEAKRMTTKVGDVFVVTFDEGTKRYLQYVLSDLTQLNSDVVRVFKTVYSQTDEPSLEQVVADEVDFYAHCVTKWGLEAGVWNRIGNKPDFGKVDVLFRSSGDVGKDIKVSENWWVWKPNEQQQFIGRLDEKFKRAELGSVVRPTDIVHRMKTGGYDFAYPGY